MLQRIFFSLLWRFCNLTFKIFSKKRASKVGNNLVVKLACYIWEKQFFITNKQKNRDNKPRLFWGPVPILNNKYWSNAMKAIGYESVTLMEEYYGVINKKHDYDYYYEDINYEGVKKTIKGFEFFFPIINKLLLVDYILNNFDIIHISFVGGIFYNDEKYWQMELDIYRRADIKIIVLPFGGDFYQYSKIYDQSWKHGLLASYPKQVQKEKNINQKINYLVDYADIINAGFQFDAIARWDILPYAIYPMDCTLWQPSTKKNHYDGMNGTVKITHTPNHRGVKGTEFIIQAVEELQREGWLVELILIEKKQNEEVRQIMQTEADIHVEQLLLSYALSGIEGMASGLPVLACLDNEVYTRVFRRFSYLNECPILNTIPENIKENLKILISNPQLRQELGKAGRQYAEKYHSFEAMQFTFEKIYDKIWYQKDVDLMNLFHPVHKNSYNNSKPLVKHPLYENRLSLFDREALLRGEKYPILKNEP